MRPRRGAGLANQKRGFGGSAGEDGRDGFVSAEIEAASQDEAVRRKSVYEFGTNPAG
jgi:hypothetical protein